MMSNILNYNNHTPISVSS